MDPLVYKPFLSIINNEFITILFLTESLKNGLEQYYESLDINIETLDLEYNIDSKQHNIIKNLFQENKHIINYNFTTLENIDENILKKIKDDINTLYKYTELTTRTFGVPLNGKKIIESLDGSINISSRSQKPIDQQSLSAVLMTHNTHNDRLDDSFNNDIDAPFNYDLNGIQAFNESKYFAYNIIETKKEVKQFFVIYDHYLAICSIVNGNQLYRDIIDNVPHLTLVTVLENLSEPNLERCGF